MLEVLCINMDEVWSLLKSLFEKIFDKALTYDKNEPHNLRKCFEEMKEHNLNLCQRKRECFEWFPSDSIENELFYNIILAKVIELPFYNPRFRGSIFKNNVFKQKFIEQSDCLLTAFLDYAVVDHCHWTGKIIGLAPNTCNLQAAIVYPKINVYAHNSAFDNQVMNLSACFGKCFNF